LRGSKTTTRTRYAVEPIRGARPLAPTLGAAHCPIEALYEEHFLQRQMACNMEALAGTEVPRPDLARRVLANLETTLPHHRIDEDDSLFPRLRRRAEPEDAIDLLVDRLQVEHGQLRAMAAALMPALACLKAGALPAAEDREALRRFVQLERRHLITENALVLPLARLRLSATDKTRILAEMRARRSASAPDEAAETASAED
jgi:hemerythrin-like domain-containing protein